MQQAKMKQSKVAQMPTNYNRVYMVAQILEEQQNQIGILQAGTITLALLSIFELVYIAKLWAILG